MGYSQAQLGAVRVALGQLGIHARGDLGGALEQLRKATWGAPASNTVGINVYNLEQAAKLLFNSYTPRRNMYPRVPGRGTGPNWRGVTKLNTTKFPMGVPDGVRGPNMTHEVKEFTGRYAQFDKGSDATFFAVLAAAGFDDLRALQALTGLRAVQNEEELMLFGGLGTYGLGTAPTVSLAVSAATGSLSNSTTYNVRVVALTLDGYRMRVDPTATVPGQIATSITVTSASPRATQYTVNGGASQISADASLSTGVGGTALDATCAAVKGAVAYAWFIGTTATNGTLTEITTVNKVTLTALKTAGTPPTGYADTVGTNFDADRSQNDRAYDGILSIMAKTGSGAIMTSRNGATLTASGNGSIDEIDALLLQLAQQNLVSPEKMWIPMELADDIATKVTTGTSSEKSQQIFINSGDGQGNVTGGIVATGYLNKYALDPSRRRIEINIHPNQPPGVITLESNTLPPVTFPDANIGGVAEIEELQGYQQIEWPLTDLKYESSVHMIAVLKHYFPGACAALTEVAPG